jgi:predicted GIY-YIG superfamily endonuclease
MAKQHRRSTYKYQQKIGRRIVGFGITKDFERREQEHQREDPRIHIVQEGRKTTEEAAREWEKQRITDWEKLRGRLPGKNKRQGG